MQGEENHSKIERRSAAAVMRLFDIAIAIVGILTTAPALAVVACIARIQTGGAIFRQERIGRHLKTFTLLKVGSLPSETPSVPTHELDVSSVTAFGRFIRRYKIDELPQLINVLRGEISMVGPRPCLPSQIDVIEWRAKCGVNGVRPGIIGLAQLRGIDMSTPELLAMTDAELTAALTIQKYLQLIFYTLTGRGMRDSLGAPTPPKQHELLS